MQQYCVFAIIFWHVHGCCFQLSRFLCDQCGRVKCTVCSPNNASNNILNNDSKMSRCVVIYLHVWEIRYTCLPRTVDSLHREYRKMFFSIVIQQIITQKWKEFLVGVVNICILHYLHFYHEITSISVKIGTILILFTNENICTNAIDWQNFCYG